MGGTMRLGAYPCIVKKKGSLAFNEYKQEKISERHRHRFEFTLRYKEQFIKAGMDFPAILPTRS